MHTEFSMTASQLRAIFPGWKLGGGSFLVRGLQRRDVTSICEIDQRLSEKALLSSLEAENEAIFLVAASKNGVLGYAQVSAIYSGALTFEIVSVRKECEGKGFEAGLVLAFLCFAIYSKVSLIKFFAPGGKLKETLVKFGIKQPEIQKSPQKAIAQLIEKGYCNILRVAGYTIDAFFNRLTLELACTGEVPIPRTYIRDYAKKHVLRTEDLDKVRAAAKDLLRLYLLKTDLGRVMDLHVLACAFTYLASLGLDGRLDRKFIMYTGELTQGNLYGKINLVLDVLEQYKPDAEKKIEGYAIDLNNDDAKNLIVRLLKNKERLDEKTSLPLEIGDKGATQVHKTGFMVTAGLLKEIFPKLDISQAELIFRAATKGEMLGMGEGNSDGIVVVHKEKIVSYACIRLEGVSLILGDVIVLSPMKHMPEALVGAVLCFAFYAKALYLTVSKNTENAVEGLQNLGLEDPNLLHKLRCENNVKTVRVMELLKKSNRLNPESLTENFKTNHEFNP